MLSLNESLYISAKAHLNDYDMGGFAYFLHPMRMAMRMRTNDQERMQIPILHDVIEDHGDEPYMEAKYAAPNFDEYLDKITEINGGKLFPDNKRVVVDVHGVKWITYMGYIAYHGSSRVVTALDCLTRRKDETYEGFGDRICENYEAVLAKIEDVDDNTRVTRLKGLRDKDFGRMQKYHKLWVQLQKAKRQFEENFHGQNRTEPSVGKPSSTN